MVLRAILAGLAIAPTYARAQASATGSPDFEAQNVLIEERGAHRVLRRTRARAARLTHTSLEGEGIEVVVPPHASGKRPAWTLRADWLMRALSEDVAQMGPLTVVTQRGDRIEAQGGRYDGSKRCLELQGPVSVREARAVTRAQRAVVTFAIDSTEIEELFFVGEVEGELRVQP